MNFRYIFNERIINLQCNNFSKTYSRVNFRPMTIEGVRYGRAMGSTTPTYYLGTEMVDKNNPRLWYVRAYLDGRIHLNKNTCGYRFRWQTYRDFQNILDNLCDIWHSDREIIIYQRKELSASGIKPTIKTFSNYLQSKYNAVAL